MTSAGTLLLTRKNVRELLGIEECIAAVEQAFRSYGEGKTKPPGILGIHANDGGFHIKAGIMDLERSYFVAKSNANFPNNWKVGLPTIQGVIVVCDAVNGRLLALMDSIEITIIRTGAATAVAAKYLAREDAKTALICGCGNQGQVSLEAIMKVRKLERVFAYDIDFEQARRFAKAMSNKLKIEISAVDDLERSARSSDICVTCTTAQKYFLLRKHIAPGTFVAAIGADSAEKQELEPALLSTSTIVTDVSEQSKTIGELHHAIRDGCVLLDDVHAELGKIVAGKRSGRTSDDEIIVFDSTGMALQDVVSAAIVYERAMETPGCGIKINFND